MVLWTQWTVMSGARLPLVPCSVSVLMSVTEALEPNKSIQRHSREERPGFSHSVRSAGHMPRCQQQWTLSHTSSGDKQRQAGTVRGSSKHSSINKDQRTPGLKD